MSHKIALTLFPVLFFSIFSAQAQQVYQSEVPVSLMDDIKLNHPNAENIMIERELHFRIPLYQVKFKTYAGQYFALFDMRGKPFGQEDRIDPMQLPTAVSRKLEKTFGEYSVLSSLLLKHPDGRIEYGVNLKVKGISWALAMSSGGNILTKKPLGT